MICVILCAEYMIMVCCLYIYNMVYVVLARIISAYCVRPLVSRLQYCEDKTY